MARKIDGDFAKAPEAWLFEERLWAISPDSFRVYVMMTVYSASQHSDGFVSTFNAGKQCGLDEDTAYELVEYGLVEEVDGGYIVRSHDQTDWSNWQYTTNEREEDRRNGARGGRAKAANAKKNEEA